MQTTTMFTLNELFEKALDKYEDRVHSRFPERDVEITYEELDAQTEEVARGLNALGITQGDRIGLYMSNVPEILPSNLGILRSGGVMVQLNDMLGKREIEFLLRNSDSKGIIVGRDHVETVEELRGELDELEHLVGVGSDLPAGWTSFEELRQLGANYSGEVPNVESTDLALLPYTSGTTGKPKGLRHTHATFANDMYGHLIEADIRYGEKMLLTTSLAHSANAFFWTGTLRGATMVIAEGFDPGQTLSLIETENVSWTFMVPTMLYRALDHESIDTVDTSSIETIVYGAAPMSSARLEEALDAFGQVFIQFYGQGEVPNLITSLQKEDHDPEHKDLLSSCGRPCIMSDVKVVDIEDGVTELERGEAGEICARAPYMMEGYHKRPEATEETIRDGWVHTGDVGRRDEDGYVYLLDRTSDVIISGGLNVYTTEVEDVIQEHDHVKHVAVVGVPDDEWGEAVKAVVVPYEGSQLTEEEIIRFAGEELADYKKPKSVDFHEQLPMTPVGKIDKKAIREDYWEDEEREIA